MTVLLDPAPDEEANFAVALLVQAGAPPGVTAKLSRPRHEVQASASQRARAAAAADLTVVISYRRCAPLNSFDPGRPSSGRMASNVAELLGGAGVRAWTRHEVFGRRPRSAHQRAVVLVGPSAATPPWQVAAAVLQALERQGA